MLSRVEPYVYVEAHAERLFTKYLRFDRKEVLTIVIVGAWRGGEIPGLLRRYPGASIIAFEPAPDNFAALTSAFGDEFRVKCIRAAVGERPGEAAFHEGSLPGTGSLLAFGDDMASRNHNVGLFERQSFGVSVTTLDTADATALLEVVDLLKIDVQGAELGVLRGGSRVISRTKAILVEVALRDSAYAHASTFGEVNHEITSCGFTLCGLGVDPVTLDGNALYVRLP